MKIKKLMTGVFAFMFAAALSPGVTNVCFAAGTQASPEANDVKYYTAIKDGKTVNTGIRSIVIDPNTYTNISRDNYINPAATDGGTAPTIRLNDATMEKIAKKYIFPKWGVVAEGIFRNQASQLVTIEGTGMMKSDTDSSESFDRHFSYSRSGVDIRYRNYDWALSDLASTLGTPPSKSGRTSTEMGEFSVLQGKVNEDEVVYSGIYPIKNLGEARTLMGKSLRACSDDDNLTVDDFLANKKDKTKKEYRLPDLADDKTGKGFCSVVTCVNRADVSYDYDYNSFGIAVYDIDVTPIAASNVKYITAAQEYAGLENPVKEARKAGVKGVYYDSNSTTARTNLIKNESPQASTNTVSLAHNISEQISATTQDTFTFGMDQSVGVDLRWGTNTDFFGITAKAQVTFRETWASMKSNGKSHTNQENRTITSQLSLPGHTGAAINQNIEEIVAEEDYQQPVIINYKVAIFAMSGDYFNGSLGVGMISSSRYDKEWMSVIFDGSDAMEQNGCKALSSLYNRAVTNMGVSGYDGVHGKYRTWCDKGAWAESTKIDWTQISEDIKNDDRSSHVLTDDYVEPDPNANLIRVMATNLQFAETATTLHVDSNAMTTSVGEVVPLYDLKSVDISKGNRVYDIKAGQTGAQDLYLDSIELAGYDEDEVPFYGFNNVKGKWILKEANGLPVTDPTKADGIELVEDSVLGQIARVKTNTEYSATFTLEWVPDTDQKIISDQSKEGMSVEDIEAITTPQIRINSVASTSDVVMVNLTGEYEGVYDKPINLNSVLNVNVTGSSGALKVPIYWEGDGSRGIKVNENGETTFTVPGEYNVRAFCRNNGASITSDWLKITTTEKSKLKSIKLNTAGLSSEDLTLNANNKTRDYDLSSFLTYYDQFGNELKEGTDESLPKAVFSLDGQDASIAMVDSAGVLTVRKGGTYKVTAKLTDSSGETMSASATLRITEEPWLSEITFNRPDVGRNDLVLNDPNDQIKISNLKNLIEYYDQNGYEWTGSKPKVTFKIDEETTGAEITAGGNYTFFAYEPGSYTIQPEVAGYDVGSVRLDVAGKKDLVITTANPSRQKLIEGEQLELELERFLNGTTVFGEPWKENLPEMYFTLDEGVDGASIETQTIKDSKTGEIVEIHKFKTDTAGEYAIHVTPKQASTYTGTIDDIIVNVVSYDKVSRLGISEIDEETLGRDLYVNAYNGTHQKINIRQFVQHFDQNGDEADPTNPTVIVPETTLSLFQYEYDQETGELLEKEVDESDATLVDGVLTIYTGGNYTVRITAPGQADIIPGETSVYVPDITWMHSFGDWEVTASTCTDAGTRVKTCQDDNCLICKKTGGEGYHEKIVDSIPATGHHWSNEYKVYDEGNGVRYAAIKCIDCGAIRPSTKITLASSQYIDGGYSTHPEWNTTTSTCEEDGRLVIKDNTMGGTQRSYYATPATGHHWSTTYVTDDAHKADCNQKGLEWIECVECHAVKPGSERAISATVDEYPINEDGTTKWDKVVEPTCETDGYKEVKCIHCDKTWKVTTPALGHTWGKEYVTDDAHRATCSKEGTEWHECTVCHKAQAGSERTVPTTDHVYPTDPDTGEIQWKTVVEPKCDEAGYREVKCTLCDNVLREELAATGHTMAKTEATHATCTEPGNEEYYTCSVCKRFYSDEAGENEIEEDSWLVPATGHAYGEWTELDEVQHQRVCIHDATHVEKADHEWDRGEVTTPATCEEDGVRTYTCDVCKATKTEAIPALGHDYVEVAGTARAATCTADGKEADRECSRCHDVQEGAKVDKLGHLYGAWTKLDDVRHQRVCARDTDHVEVAAHEWDEGKVTKAATCEEDGIRTYTCAACGATRTEAIPATGHEWGAWTEAKASTCVQRGQEVRVCAHDAGHVEYRYKALLLHDLTKVAPKSATCTTDGTKEHYVCSVCQGVFTDDEGKIQVSPEDLVVRKLGHDYVTVAGTAVAATCTEDGKEADQECSRCSDVKEGAKIAMLGHAYGKWMNLDANQHQRVCSHDAAHVEKEKHAWDAGTVTKAATTTSTGVRTFTCTTCGATRKATIAKVAKKANTLAVSGKKVTVKGSSKGKKGKLKKKKTLKASKVFKFASKGQGKLTYVKKSGNKKITINKKTGKVTVKKGLKKGTYKVKIKVKAAGNANYNASGTKTVTVKVKVK